MCKVSALNMKTILNKLKKCVLVKQNDWNNFFWLFEKNWFFTFLTQHFISKKQKFQKMRKNEFWWHIWACHSHFSRYRVFKCQNWIKILVFRTFFSGNLLLLYYKKNGQSPKKKSCFLKWPPQLFHFFACDLTRDTTYIPQLDYFSVL